MRWRAKSSKLQHPSSRETPMTRFQFSKPTPGAAASGICGLLFHWMLELGAWNFPFRHAANL
jgi:hypothetical protein